MQLTATEFAKLINDLKCDVRQGERRQNPRAPARAIVDAVFVDPELPAGKFPQLEKLRVRDISRTGLGMIINREIRDNTRIIVQLPKSKTETLSLLVMVVRTQRLPGQMYQMGTKMMRRITTAEFDGYMAQQDGAVEVLMTDPQPAAAATQAA